MTTKVVIATPDNSLHNSLVYVEKRQGDDAWARLNEPIIVEPHGQAEPLYIDAATRVVIEEQRPNIATPYPTAAPQSGTVVYPAPQHEPPPPVASLTPTPQPAPVVTQPKPKK